jgi:hypothetical protein
LTLKFKLLLHVLKLCANHLLFLAGHVAAAREQLLMQTQQISQKRSEKPPKLPPRDNMYPHDIPRVSLTNIWKTFSINSVCYLTA